MHVTQVYLQQELQEDALPNDAYSSLPHGHGAGGGGEGRDGVGRGSVDVAGPKYDVRL